MKIGIDTQSTVGEKTGIGIFTRYLLDALRKVDDKNTYIEYKNTQWKELNIPKRLAWENLSVPKHVFDTKPDLLFVPGFAPPIIKPCKTVAVLHDLIGVLFPQNLGFFSRIYWSRWLPFSIKHADFIICDSESTRKDCINIMKIKEDRIKVIYPAAFTGTDDRQFGNEAGVMDKYGIKGKYVLSLSTIEPRKNFPRLVEAWRKIKDTCKDRIYLVIVGRKGWGWPALEDKIRSLGMEEDVIVVGYADEKEKNVLYKNCEFFIFPSLYEGFGLPVLEAMNFKKAVISSDNSSLPEITGPCALFIDPYDVNNIADAVIKLMNDKGLREELALKGFERSKLFSWEKCAHEFIEIFEISR